VAKLALTSDKHKFLTLTVKSQSLA